MFFTHLLFSVINVLQKSAPGGRGGWRGRKVSGLMYAQQHHCYSSHACALSPLSPTWFALTQFKVEQKKAKDRCHRLCAFEGTFPVLWRVKGMATRQPQPVGSHMNSRWTMHMATVLCRLPTLAPFLDHYVSGGVFSQSPPPHPLPLVFITAR